MICLENRARTRPPHTYSYSMGCRVSFDNRGPFCPRYTRIDSRSASQRIYRVRCMCDSNKRSLFGYM
jgi:hypothetical protein